MARTRKGTPPGYPKRPHVSGQARITVRLTNGKRHDITLGAFGSPESRAEYQRVLAELEANGGRYPVKDDGTVATGLTLNELALLFWRHAKDYYRLADGAPSRELEHYKYALNQWPNTLGADRRNGNECGAPIVLENMYLDEDDSRALRKVAAWARSLRSIGVGIDHNAYCLFGNIIFRDDRQEREHAFRIASNELGAETPELRRIWRRRLVRQVRCLE